MNPAAAYLSLAVSFVLARFTWRWVSRHLFLCGYALTHSRKGAMALHSLIILPGTVLHESSHWLACKLLGVRTLGISFFPSLELQENGIQGWVMSDGHQVGFVRQALVGAAPLLTGSLALLFIGDRLLGISELLSAAGATDWTAIRQLFAASLQVPLFGLWFYLAFAVANSMEPSPADRQAWPALLATLIALGVLLALIGLEEWLSWAFTTPLPRLALYLTLAFSIASAVNLLMMGVLALIELALRSLSRP